MTAFLLNAKYIFYNLQIVNLSDFWIHPVNFISLNYSECPLGERKTLFDERFYANGSEQQTYVCRPVDKLCGHVNTISEI